MAGPEIKTVSKVEELPGGVLPQGDSPEDAVKGLFDALGSEGEEFAEEPVKPSKPTGEEEIPAGSEEEKVEESEEPEDGDEDDEVDDSDDTPDDGDDAAAKAADLIEVTLPGGEKIKVTREEAAAGYSRTQDYTRKRQADAAEHKAEMEQVREIRTKYADRLEKLTETLKSLGPKQPDAALRTTNPGEWAARTAEYEAFQSSLEQVGGAKAAISDEEKAELNTAAQAHIESEWTKVVTAVPEWADAAKANPALAELRSFAMKEHGFTEAEIDNLADHRLLLMLRENFTLRQRRDAAAKGVEEKREKVGVKLEPGASQASRQTPKARRAKMQKQADQRAAQTGSVTDAARAIELMLADED